MGRPGFKSRFRRGEKSTDIRVGFVKGMPALIANLAGKIKAVPFSLDGVGNILKDTNFGNLRIKGDAFFDSGASTLRIKSDGISIKESGIEMAKFGSSITLGNVSAGGRLVIGANDVDMYDEAGNNVLNIDTGVVTIGHHATTKIVLNGVAGTLTLGEFSVNASGVINVDDITLDGKITLSSTGTRNVAIGTGNQDVSGMEDNISIGVDAGNSLEDGATQNIAIGTHALYTNATGDYNTCVGYYAGNAYPTSGVSLTAIGASAGLLVTGTQNTCLGALAGDAIVAGTHNTCIGFSADCVATSVNRTVIGYDADGQANNSVTLGNSDVTAVYMAEDSGATVHCGAVVHGLAAVNVTSSTLAYATHSLSKLKYVTVSADAQTLVLPAVQIGAVFIIVNIAADGGALLTIDPDGNDKFLTNIAGGVGTDGNNISNTKATQNQGDFVKLVGMSADGWAITEIGGIWADE